MRAILSEVHSHGNQQSLTLELIDVPFVVNDLAMIFMENNAKASRLVPIKRREHHHVVDVTIAVPAFIFEQDNQREFSWAMYLTFNVDTKHYLLEVESEYVSDRHQLTLDSYFQFNADSQNHALLEIHTGQNPDEFVVNSINLTKDGLTITGHNAINDQPLGNQCLLLENATTETVAKYATATELLRGLFSVTMPIADLTEAGPYDLYVEYDYHSQHVRQRLVLDRELTGQSGAQVLPSGRIGRLERAADGRIQIQTDAPVSLKHKVVALGSKAERVKLGLHQLHEKLSNRYMRWLFKQGHRPFATTTIIFESFGGRQISDSPLAIYQMFKQLYPGFHFVWSVERELVPYCKANHIAYVVRRTARWARTLEKAQYWISNARFPAWVKKPKYVTYVQTWHGTPLKKLGLDIENVVMPGTTTEAYHRNFVQEANRWDALVSPNDYSTQIFRSAFGFNNQILKVGYPRNDELINATPVDITAIKQKLKIPLDKKVVMYAPTYRDNQFVEKGKYTFELPFSLADFKQRFGEDTVLILRMHYLISNALDVSEYSDFVYDLSSYPNISDLYLVSDLLITDYSSVFFDYAYLKRPILFYPYDYQLYQGELRGFYLDYERDLPGTIAHNEAELLVDIRNGLRQPDMSQNSKFRAFYERFCAIDDGQAAIKVVRYVMHQIEANQ